MVLKINSITLLLYMLLSFTGCGLYSFSGTSIPPSVESFSVGFFENNAPVVSPLLSQSFTEKMKTKFISETNLSIVETNGDFSFSGYIQDYVLQPVSAQGNDNAQMNRLSITVWVKLDCPKESKLSFEQSFSQFGDFDANTNFNAIETQLIDEITDRLIQEIFNKAAINW